MEDTLTGEERRGAVLDTINAVRKYATNAHTAEKFIEELDLLQQRIEGANVLETYMKDFGGTEYRKAEAIFQKIRVQVKQNFKKRDIRIKRRFQASVIPIGLYLFSLFYFMVHQVKLVPADFAHEAVCISIGILISTVFFILDTLIMYFVNERVSAKEDWTFSKQVFIMLLVATIIFFPYYFAVQFNSTRLYLLLSPYLVNLIQSAIKLDIGALFAFASLILGDLAALFAVWEFIQKKLRKQKNDLLFEEHTGENE